MNERRLVEQESPSWTAQGARVPGFGPTLLRPPTNGTDRPEHRVRRGRHPVLRVPGRSARVAPAGESQLILIEIAPQPENYL